MNLLENLTRSSLAERGLTWEHQPLKWEALPGAGMCVYVPAKVDYFQDPAGAVIKDDAPYLWLGVNGDFVVQAHVRPTHTSTYDAGALMVRSDEYHYAKLCYESTDLGTKAAVSVVTNGVSDDANGVDLTVPDIWLQACRIGDVFGLHYALDGSHWRMVRVFKLPMPPLIKVGLVAQCPVWPGTTIDLLSFTVESRTVKNLRAGV
jgi:uncharacterized protein